MRSANPARNRWATTGAERDESSGMKLQSLRRHAVRIGNIITTRHTHIIAQHLVGFFSLGWVMWITSYLKPCTGGDRIRVRTEKNKNKYPTRMFIELWHWTRTFYGCVFFICFLCIPSAPVVWKRESNTLQVHNINRDYRTAQSGPRGDINCSFRIGSRLDTESLIHRLTFIGRSENGWRIETYNNDGRRLIGDNLRYLIRKS